MITFNHPHNVDLSGIELEEGECTFLYQPDLGPHVEVLVKELLEKLGDDWELTELGTSPWMHVMRGPVDGIGWHNEGTREDDYSLVYAMNDSSAALEFEDCVSRHKRGRAVVFKSSTQHRVQRLDSHEYRYALAFLMHGGSE